MPDTLVVNASPLIFLSNAGQLDLLRAIGAGRVLVPPSVLDEVTAPAPLDRGARAVVETLWIERAPAVRLPTEIIEWDLGPGESAVIATCLQLADAAPVLDDLAGRKCARAFGLPVIGTVGVVVAAYRRGKIADPRRMLLDLRESGMWLSDAVIDHALRLAGL